MKWTNVRICKKNIVQKEQCKVKIKSVEFCVGHIRVWVSIRTYARRQFVNADRNLNSENHIDLLRYNLLSVYEDREHFSGIRFSSPYITCPNFFSDEDIQLLENWPAQCRGIDIVRHCACHEIEERCTRTETTQYPIALSLRSRRMWKITIRKSELMQLYESMSTARIINSILFSVLKEIKWKLFPVGPNFYMDFFI